LEIFFNLTVFYIVTLLFFLSFSGYGKILLTLIFDKKFNYNPFEIPIFGLIFYLIIGYLSYITIGFNSYLNLFLLSSGIYFFYYSFNKKDFNYIFRSSFLILLFFSLLLISKTHEDFPSYHFLGIKDIFENKLTLGGANILLTFAHISLFSYVQSLIVMPIYVYKFIHIPIFVIYFATLGYFYNQSKKFKIKKLENFFCNFILIILIIKFTRLSEYGYDYISQFLLLIVFHKVFFYKKNLLEINKSFLIFIFAVLIKPTAILFFPLFLLLFYKNKIYQIIFKINKKFLIIFLLLNMIFISNSFIRTGCLFYPVNSTCFSKEKIEWSTEEDMKQYSNTVQLWAKGFYHQDKSKYKETLNEQEFKNNFSWFKYWVDLHYFYTINEFLLILTFIFLCFAILIIKVDLKKISNKTKELLTPVFLSFLSIFLWLNSVPDYRFGFASIIIFIFTFYCFFLNENYLIYKNRMSLFLILAILFFNIKNTHRIYKEFKREDIYQYKNFPWFSLNSSNIDNLKIKIEDYGFYRIVYKL
jgi:hypothetical protein